MSQTDNNRKSLLNTQARLLVLEQKLETLEKIINYNKGGNHEAGRVRETKGARGSTKS